MRRPTFLLGPALFVIACSGDGSGGPGPTPQDSTAAQDSLHFLRPAATAPALGTRVVSFYAVRGSTREVRLMYRARPGAPDSSEFARFRVEDRSLVTRPDGSTIAPGDSVLITLEITDTLQYITDFQPAGLKFAAGRPARLWLKFGEADPDLNHDNVVNAVDTALLLALKIWKQEQPGQPWSLLPSSVDTVSKEVEADITGFTRYALSY
jgi:hypothetical protein